MEALPRVCAAGVSLGPSTKTLCRERRSDLQPWPGMGRKGGERIRTAPAQGGRRGSGNPETIQTFCRRCLLPGQQERLSRWPAAEIIREGSHQHLWHQDLPAANQELLGAGPHRSRPRGWSLRSWCSSSEAKSHPAESSWVSTTACKAPKTLSGEERGVWWPPREPRAVVEKGKAASCVELVRDWQALPSSPEHR